jgi:hypothetical protein
VKTLAAMIPTAQEIKPIRQPPRKQAATPIPPPSVNPALKSQLAAATQPAAERANTNSGCRPQNDLIQRNPGSPLKSIP